MMTITTDLPNVLQLAIDALDRGDCQQGGKLLVEAAREILYSRCDQQDCLPTRPSSQTAASLLKAYHKAARLDPGTWKMLAEIIAGGMRGARGDFIKPGYLKGCAELLSRWASREGGTI